MLKPIQIRIMNTSRSGTARVIEINGAFEDTTTHLTDHDIAGILFSIEFAANNHASEILGQSIRVHITEPPPEYSDKYFILERVSFDEKGNQVYWHPFEGWVPESQAHRFTEREKNTVHDGKIFTKDGNWELPANSTWQERR